MDSNTGNRFEFTKPAKRNAALKPLLPFFSTIALLALVVFFLYTTYIWKFFSHGYAGSFPAAETWELDGREEEVIKAIAQLKKQNPTLEPVHQATPNNSSHGDWYFVDFHYEDTNEDLQVYLRPSLDSLQTTIGLVAIFPHWDTLMPIEKMSMLDRKEINRDYGYFENKKQIAKFREKIVEPLQAKVK